MAAAVEFATSFIRYSDNVRAVGINLDFYLWAIGGPVISHDSSPRRLPYNIHRLRCDSAQGFDVRRFILGVRIGLTRDEDLDVGLDRVCLELPDSDPCAWNLSAKGCLQWPDNLRREFLVADLDDHARESVPGAPVPSLDK
jgi:hypothetical protein